MATQGNLFGGVGKPIGSSLFDPISAAASTGAMSPAQRSAMVFMQNGPSSQFRLPESVGPQRQGAFDFSAPPKSFGARMRGMAKAGGRMALSKGNVAFELALMPAIAIGGAISGAGQWGSATGLEEDYVGGAVYGGVRGSGAAVGGAIGSVAGGFVGGAVGSIFGPAGTTLGFLGGTVAGALVGDTIGGSILQDPARRIGMGARAIVKTARATDRIQFGGNFTDSRAAHTMRQRAVQDMSGSMMNARQFLGNEAVFLHG